MCHREVFTSFTPTSSKNWKKEGGFTKSTPKSSKTWKEEGGFTSFTPKSSKSWKKECTHDGSSCDEGSRHEETGCVQDGARELDRGGPGGQRHWQVCHPRSATLADLQSQLEQAKHDKELLVAEHTRANERADGLAAELQSQFEQAKHDKEFFGVELTRANERADGLAAEMQMQLEQAKHDKELFGVEHDRAERADGLAAELQLQLEKAKHDKEILGLDNIRANEKAEDLAQRFKGLRSLLSHLSADEIGRAAAAAAEDEKDLI